MVMEKGKSVAERTNETTWTKERKTKRSKCSESKDVRTIEGINSEKKRIRQKKPSNQNTEKST